MSRTEGNVQGAGRTAEWAHLGGMAVVAGAVGELLEEDGLRELGARLVGGPEVEVDADVGVVALLAVHRVLDRQDVEGHHEPIDGHQDALILLVYLHSSDYRSRVCLVST